MADLPTTSEYMNSEEATGPSTSGTQYLAATNKTYEDIEGDAYDVPRRATGLQNKIPHNADGPAYDVPRKVQGTTEEEENDINEDAYAVIGDDTYMSMGRKKAKK